MEKNNNQDKIDTLLHLYYVELANLLLLHPVDCEMVGQTWEDGVLELEAEHGINYKVTEERVSNLISLLTSYGYVFEETTIRETPGLAIINQYAVDRIEVSS